VNATFALDVGTLAMLREGFARFRQKSYAFEARQRWLESDEGYSGEAWREYAALGWLALPLPEAHGGFGDDPRALAALMEYTGSALALEPILASSVLCGRLLARCRNASATRSLEGVATGERIFAFAHTESADEGVSCDVSASWRNGRLSGAKSVVLHGDAAGHLIVTAKHSGTGALAFCCVDAASPGVAATRYRLVDGRGAASFAFENADAELLDVGDAPAAVLEAVLDDARLALCAETLGAVVALNAATSEYLKTRTQFGRPIGSNQALQHRMVDLHILQEELRAVIDAAQRAWGDPGAERTRAIGAAAAHAATVGRQAAHEAVQMHGGMGITSELPVSHYFKRLMVTARLAGDREEHLARFAAYTAAPEAAQRD
jgi:alkylation response protein AidB-like acyl-CoA dehydrogenase